jgi:cobalt-zinc-cadmium efflux system outer membrane protein
MKHKSFVIRGLYGLVPALMLATPSLAQGGETFPLDRLEAMAAQGNLAIKAAASDVDAARGAVQTATAYPNPEVEYLAGSSRYRPGVDGLSGRGDSLSLSQPLDLPFRRKPRIAAATSGLAARQAGLRAFQADWMADLRRGYYDVLRRGAEKANAQEDLALMQQLRDGIALKVKVGDAPRIELIRAEADLLQVKSQVQAAALRETQARLNLRKLVSADLPENFEITGQLETPLRVASLPALVDRAIAANPELDRARAEREQARYRLKYEEAGRLPTVALRATRETDRELRQFRLGVSLSIPLWDRRQGPMREAEADLARSSLSLDAQTYAIKQDLEVAYRQFEVAQAQVAALESGLVAQARAAVAVAETAYRAGERGLIDVLDAQRVFRSARADLIASRFELAAAWVEIQRLVAPMPNVLSDQEPK